MRKGKFELNFSVEEVLTSAQTNGFTVINPITGEKPSYEYMVEVQSRPVVGNELCVVNYIVNNIDVFSIENWYMCIYCNDDMEYTIGIVFATSSIANANDTAHALGNRIWSRTNEYIKPYETDDCFTMVQKYVKRRDWLNSFNKYKRIEIC